MKIAGAQGLKGTFSFITPFSFHFNKANSKQHIKKKAGKNGHVREPVERAEKNQLEADIIEKGEEYIYSGAKYYYEKGCGLIKIEFLLCV